MLRGYILLAALADTTDCYYPSIYAHGSTLLLLANVDHQNTDCCHEPVSVVAISAYVR